MNALAPFTGRTPRVALVITTCRQFMDRTLPLLYHSLAHAQVPKQSIYTYCEGVATTMWMDYHKIQPCQHNAWDLSGLIEWTEEFNPHLERTDYDFIFTLPDTCTVGPGFWFHVLHAAMLAVGKYDVVGLREEYPMCFIGLWSPRYLGEHLGAIKEVACNTTKEQIIRLEIDGKLKRLAYGKYAWMQAENREWTQQSDPYRTGQLRWARAFTAFEILKWTIARNLAEVDEKRAREL